MEAADEEIDASYISSENEKCPHCRTTKRAKPDLVLFVGYCGHFLCNTCLDNLFHNRAIMPCPSCMEERRRFDYEERVFDSGHVHRTVRIYKKELADLRLTSEDFDEDLEAFNNYLELRQDIAYNLANNIDLDETHARLKAFLEDNADKIQRNKERLKLMRMKRLEAKRMEDEAKRQRLEIARKKAEEDVARRREDRDVFMKAILGGLDRISARKKLREHQEARSKLEAFVKPEPKVQDEAHFGEIRREEQAPCYVYKMPRPLIKFPPPKTPFLDQKQYSTFSRMSRTAQEAGGFRPQWHTKKALQAAYMDL